jgi:predicted DNA binding CopG/RHH family protein
VPAGAPVGPLGTQILINSSLEREVRDISKVAKQKVKRMNLIVPVELHNAFKSAAAAQGQNMTEVLLEFIEQYVTKHSSSKPKGRLK